VHTNTPTHTQAYAHVHAHTHAQAHAHAHTHAHMYMHALTHTQACTHSYTSICTYTSTDAQHTRRAVMAVVYLLHALHSSFFPIISPCSSLSSICLATLCKFSTRVICVSYAAAIADRRRQSRGSRSFKAPADFFPCVVRLQSAPHMYGIVLMALELRAGHKLLNIGSGTGYLSCIAGVVLGDRGINHGM